MEVPFNLTPTHGSVQYTLTVNEDYDNVATVGQNRILVVNFTRPTRTNTNTTEEPTEEDTSSDNRVDLSEYTHIYTLGFNHSPLFFDLG